MSYFEHYFNLAGERTLRGYGRPVNLARFDRLRWMTTEEDLWPIAEHLERIRHIGLMPQPVAQRLSRLDRRSRMAGTLYHPKANKPA
jgi:hypothetical protein